MARKKGIPSKIPASTSDTGHQSPASEVEEVRQIPASPLPDAPLDLAVRTGQTQSLRNVPEPSNASKRHQDGRSGQDTPSSFGVSKTPKRQKMDRGDEIVLPPTSASRCKKTQGQFHPSLLPTFDLNYFTGLPLYASHNAAPFIPIPAEHPLRLADMNQGQGAALWQLNSPAQKHHEIPDLFGILNEYLDHRGVDHNSSSTTSAPLAYDMPGTSHGWNQLSIQGQVPERSDKSADEQKKAQGGSDSSGVRSLKRKRAQDPQEAKSDSDLKKKGEKQTSEKLDSRGGYCAAATCNKEQYQSHIYEHQLKEKGHPRLQQCSMPGCRKFYPSWEERREHERNEHRERKELRCAHCHYSSDKRWVLGYHIERKHLCLPSKLVRKFYKCPHCDDYCSVKKCWVKTHMNAKKHRNEERGVPPREIFYCPKCDFASTEKLDVENHIETHPLEYIDDVE